MADVDSWDGVGTLPPLYTKTATGAVNTWVCWVEGSDVCVTWGQQGGAMQMARFACKPKNEGRANATTAEQQAVKEAVAKWKKQQKPKNGYTLSVEQTEEFVLSPMLAHDFNKHEKKLVYPVDVQPKYNGLRCLAHVGPDGQVHLRSRGGDPYSVAHISTALQGRITTDRVLDGELYVHGMRLQEISSLVRRPQPQSVLLEYHTYDYPSLKYEEPWRERRDILNTFHYGLGPSPVKVAYTYEATTKNSVMAFHDLFVQNGFEGAIVRAHTGIYKFGYRSAELLKVKAFQEDEFEVIGWTPGKGKFSNVPIFKCKTAEGKEFDVTPTGSEDERATLFVTADDYIGKMYTVRYFDFTADGIPSIPVGVHFREKGE